MTAAAKTRYRQADAPCGFEPLGADAFASSEAPEADALAFYGSCFVDSEGGRWQEINLRALARFAPFLSIGA